MIIKARQTTNNMRTYPDAIWEAETFSETDLMNEIGVSNQDEITDYTDKGSRVTFKHNGIETTYEITVTK